MRDRILTTLAAVTLLSTVAPAPSSAQTAFDACYVPDVGAMYLINLSGLPTSCLATDHVQISWSEGSGVSDHGSLSGLADDDHGQYLLTDGVRDATDGFAVTGTAGTGATPTEGAGVRMMWYPGKAAFRAGWVGKFSDGSEWNDANVGEQSVAFGTDTEASGIEAVAMGVSTTASGSESTAMGSSTEASGNNATAMGENTTAQARGSLVIGRRNVLEGSQTSWVDTDPLLVAGNGTSLTPSNALTLLKNGNMTIAGMLTENSDARLKTGIEPLGDVLKGLSSIEPVRFRFRRGTGHPTGAQIGLIAQEVQAVFPELVTRDSEGYLSLAYPKLTAVLVKALQEQQVQLDEQRARIEDRDGTLKRLIERIDRLEARVEREGEVQR